MLARSRACRVFHFFFVSWQALALNIFLWIERVPSHSNIADLPSRESYSLVRSLRAEWWDPTIASLFFVSTCD